MSQDPTQPQAPEPRPGSAEAWQEVGKQFQVLGETLAHAIRSSVNNEENRKRMQEMQGGLEKMVSEVGKAIQDTATSPQVKQVRTEAGKTAHSVFSAGDRTFQEIRPHILTALRQLNAELDKLIHRSESSKPPEEPKASEPPGPDTKA